ncbi:putative serine/threonine-protein kinase pim-3, partial [Triplophysa rosa]
LEIHTCQYEIGELLGAGGYGSVFEGTRVGDGLKVAVKYVPKKAGVRYINLPEFSEPIPLEVALQVLATGGSNVPEIVKLLDWQDRPGYYIMVLERPAPCTNLREFCRSKGEKLSEELARVIMRQATRAAYICCRQGVFHSDIKQNNLLINPETLQVKLIDFGCGFLLKETPYTTYEGTRNYCCPDNTKTGQYYGKLAMVYSLGVLLFTMVCGRYPHFKDKCEIRDTIWYKDELSIECCRLIQACLQENPEERIHLEEMLGHKWFQTPRIDGNLENNKESDVRIEGECTQKCENIINSEGV